MARLRDLPALLEKRGDDVRILVRERKRDVAKAVAERLVLTTPVDTGQARGSWVASLGSPTEEPPTDWAPTPADAIGRVEAVVSAAKDEKIYLVNAVAYIILLRDGYSPQAAAGWVDRSIEEGLRSVKKE